MNFGMKMGSIFSAVMIKQASTFEYMLRLEHNCLDIHIPFPLPIYNNTKSINVCVHHLLDHLDSFIFKCLKYLNKL